MKQEITRAALAPLPQVPAALLEPEPTIVPCPALGGWAAAAFFDPASPLFNDQHHLGDASIGWLWTNVENSKGGRRILGTAALGEPAGGTPWARARAEEQLLRWFGRVPDFVVTVDAVWLSTANIASACALIEHELYHCAQKRDRWGELVFNKDGEPVWCIRPHDVEEFVGVVARYGASAARMQDMAEAIAAGPTFGAAELNGICGVCHG